MKKQGPTLDGVVVGILVVVLGVYLLFPVTVVLLEFIMYFGFGRNI